MLRSSVSILHRLGVTTNYNMFSVNNYVTVLLLLLPVIINSQQYTGDLCTIKSTGTQGVCQLLSKCQPALDELQKNQRFPQTCGFEGTQPIVCCAQSQRKPQRKPGQISYKKCQEYSSYIIETNPDPTLLLDDEITTKKECGHKVVTLIVGGTPAERKEFPHMAALGYGDSLRDMKWLCGGSIISPQYILTAGHCLAHNEFGTVKYARMGVTKLSDVKTTFLQDIRVSQIIPHPDYKSSSHYNDIALLKLERPATMNSYCRPACLYRNPQVIGNQRAMATGWGNTQYAGVSSDALLKVTLDLFEHPRCNQTYKNQIGRRLKNGIVDETQFCAGSLTNEEKDTCQGDSGGPLQIYHTNDKIECMYDIIGVTSFGKACSGTPGVYTRVSYFIKWIEDTVWPETA